MSELSHKTVIIYISIFLVVIITIGLLLYFLVFRKKSNSNSTSCSADTDCSDGQVCDTKSGNCITPSNTQKCASNKDCSDGQLCNTNGLCVLPNFIVAFGTKTIPDGWIECDGTNGTPDTRGKFIKGGAIVDLKKTGGQASLLLNINQMPAHTHYVPTPMYDNQVNNNGSDTSCMVYRDMTSNYPAALLTGIQETTQLPMNLMPPYTTVIFGMNSYSDKFPTGSIIWFYSSSTVPTPAGWTVYTNEKFLLGKSQDYDIGSTGGSQTHTLNSNEIPPHKHTYNYPYRVCNNNFCDGGSKPNRSCPDCGVINSIYALEGITSAPIEMSASASFNILPSYYTLSCIQKISDEASLPVGAICIFASKQIPDKWVICNGINGTPDLRNNFIYTSLTSGTIGGTSTVTLTSGNIPAHTHKSTYYEYPAGNNRCLYEDNVNNRFSSVSGSPPDSGSHNYENKFTTNAICDPDSDSTCKQSTLPYGKPIPLSPPYITLLYIMKIK